MSSIYKIAQYTIFWKFPSVIERNALAAEASEVLKFALQESDNSLWMLLNHSPLTWMSIPLTSSAAVSADIYIPEASFDGEVVPSGHQRLVYGDFEIVGTLTLEGNLVLL